LTLKPRIMLVGPWPPTIGGVTTFMLNVVNSSLKERYELFHFTTSRPPKKNVINNSGYQSLARGGIGRFIQGAAVTIWHLAIFPFIVIARHPNVVQVHASDFQTFWEAALYVLMSRMLRRPVLMRLGGAFDHFYHVSSPRAQSLICRVIRLPNRLIVQSSYWSDFVGRLGRSTGVIILPNSVPDALTEPMIRPARKAPVCLFIAGTEAVRKGVEELFAAMRALVQLGIAVQFRLIAMPPMLTERLVAEGIACLVEVEDYVQHDQVLAAMRSADIFLLPSHGEGFPNSLLEAMAMGLACVVTPVGAVPEVVGMDGALVVPARDSAALTEAIARLTLDTTLRLQLAERGRAIVRERYVESAVIPVLDRAWDGLLHQSMRALASD
jgi:glycosyltransferase involved in cell wall biosynthesis